MHVCKLATSCILKRSQSLWLLWSGYFSSENGLLQQVHLHIRAQVSYVSSVSSVIFLSFTEVG